jgi:hypothetical protein
LRIAVFAFYRAFRVFVRRFNQQPKINLKHLPLSAIGEIAAPSLKQLVH